MLQPISAVVPLFRHPVRRRIVVLSGLVLASIANRGAWADCPLPPNAAGEHARFSSPDVLAGDRFGFSLDIAGNWMIVGAPEDDEPAPSNSNQGAAFIYEYDGLNWNFRQKLTASDPNSPALPVFGHSVAISGNAAVIGAPDYRDEATSRARVGKAYFFRYDGASWVEEAGIIPAVARFGDAIGRSVSIDGDAAAVGAPYDDDKCLIDSSPTFESGFPPCFENCDSGAVYVYRHDGMTWNEEAKLTSPDTDFRERLGEPVLIRGDLIFAGAWLADGETPVCTENPPTINLPNGSGAVYVFRRTAGAWTQEARLTPPNPALFDNFGHSIDYDGTTLAIGALNPDGGGQLNAGNVFVYHYDGASWVLDQTLIHSDVERFDRFGTAVSVEGDTMLISAPESDDACEANEFCNSGSAYVFRFNGLEWIEQVKLLPSDPQQNDFFGFSLKLRGGLAAISMSLGDDACPANPDCNSGAVYVYPGADDCTGNGVIDLCDVADDPQLDANGNGVPDSCEGGCSLAGDIDGDTLVDGRDLDGFTQCLLSGGANGGNCPCGDLDGVSGLTVDDVPFFVDELIH